LKSLDLVILAGGFGTRLHSITNKIPKALMPVGKQVFLDIQLKQLLKYELGNIYLSLHYKNEHFLNYIEKSEFKEYVIPIIESTPLGTGGAIKHVINNTTISSPFFVVNGDSLSSINLDEMKKSYNYRNFKALIGTSYVKDASRYGTLEFSDDLTVTSFNEKGYISKGWVNNGHYLFDRTAFQGFNGSFSAEKTLFPALANNRQLGVYKVQKDNFIDIGVPADYKFLCDQFGS